MWRREGRITPGQEQALMDYWPRWGLTFSSGYDWQKIFGRDAPLVMDIGFGNGESVIALALAHPEWNIIGIDVYRPGVGHLLRQVAENNIENVRVFCHDAVEVLQALDNNVLSRVQIFFPDPWQKKRHHKRRLIQVPFVQMVIERLCEGGELVLATDWEEYASHMMEVLSAASQLKNVFGTLQFAERDEIRPLTKFERRGHRAGHSVWDVRFIKSH